METATVKIELASGPRGSRRVTKQEMQCNIDSIQRQIDNKKQVSDDISLMDTISILEGIQRQLPDEMFCGRY